VSTIVDHGYIPEEHAPDPVHSHGDPTPPGKIAIWLFLASEVMFFIGLLGTYIILRSGQPKLFSDHHEILSKPLAGLNTLVLIFSSLTMALAVDAAHKRNQKKTVICLFITFLCACGFMVVKAIEYTDKYHHYTVVQHQGSTIYAYDGHSVHHDDKGKEVGPDEMMIHGYRMEVTSPAFDIHLISEYEMHHKATEVAKKAGTIKPNEKAPAGYYVIPKNTITQQMWYGPWKNNFFGSYFVLTGVHGLHVICGMIPIFILMVQSMRGRPAIEYTGLYWHLVDLIWIFLFPLLYLV
jgi:cytochrome c oxidase subunit III